MRIIYLLVIFGWKLVPVVEWNSIKNKKAQSPKDDWAKSFS